MPLNKPTIHRLQTGAVVTAGPELMSRPAVRFTRTDIILEIDRHSIYVLQAGDGPLTVFQLLIPTTGDTADVTAITAVHAPQTAGLESLFHSLSFGFDDISAADAVAAVVADKNVPRLFRDLVKLAFRE